MDRVLVRNRGPHGSSGDLQWVGPSAVMIFVAALAQTPVRVLKPLKRTITRGGCLLGRCDSVNPADQHRALRLVNGKGCREDLARVDQVHLSNEDLFRAENSRLIGVAWSGSPPRNLVIGVTRSHDRPPDN